jgi:hypothetical protein
MREILSPLEHKGVLLIDLHSKIKNQEYLIEKFLIQPDCIENRLLRISRARDFDIRNTAQGYESVYYSLIKNMV